MKNTKNISANLYRANILLLFFAIPFCKTFAQVNQLTYELKQKVDLLEKAAEKNLVAGEKSAAINNYTEIAEIYKKQKLYSLSANYYNKALQPAKELSSSYKLNAIYYNLINLYKAQGKWGNSLSVEKEKIQLSRKTGNKKALANDLINIAYTFRKLKQYNDAIKQLEEALKLSLFEIKNEQLSIKCYKELANNYKLLGNKEKFNEYSNLVKRIEVEKTTNALKNKTEKAENKVKIKEGELEETSTKLDKVSDSLLTVADSLTKEKELTREQQLELEVQNAHIAQQEVELKINRYIIYFLIIIFFITLTGVLFWYHEFKKKKAALQIVLQQKEEIYQQKEEIQAQNEELEFQRDALYRSNKTKEKLLSVVAHDLKNPIHALIGFSDLLINDKNSLSIEEKDQYIEYIHSSSLQIHNLLENLLKWAQSQSSSIKYQPETTDINELIDINLSLFAESAAKKHIELSFDLKSKEKVFADKNMINTVIRNLINNAIKFTGKNGKISVLAKTAKDFIELSITDTGVGMTDEIINKILKTDDFHSSTGTMEEPGTGLGLAICKEFLEAHGTRLQILSQPGKGSTFFFQVPAAKNT